jgi:hypothetical protein
LDSYYNERYLLGVQVLDWSRAQVAIMRPDPDARALNAIFRDLMNTRDGATYIAGRVWGIHTHYDLGDGHELVGHSVPNFELDNGMQMGELMLNGQGILLDFDRNPSLKTWVDEFGDRIRYVSGKAKEQLGLSAVLIRPDGYIAWAADQQVDLIAVKEAAAKWFVAPAPVP